MAQLKLSAPWVVFYKEIQEMFRTDPGVHVVYDEGEGDVGHVRLYVEEQEKADALSRILIRKKDFGSISMDVTVIPANGCMAEMKQSPATLFRAAFDGNDALEYISTVRGIFANDLNYVVFKNCVVQYFNDDLGDAHGVCSTLYQEIAKDIFEPMEGVFYCTDVPAGKSFGFPLGEWP